MKLTSWPRGMSIKRHSKTFNSLTNYFSGNSFLATCRNSCQMSKKLFHLDLTMHQLWWIFNRDKVGDNQDILKMRKLVYSNSFYVINCVKTTFFQRDFQRDKKHFSETSPMFQTSSANGDEDRERPVNCPCFTRRALFDRRLLGEDCAETSTRKQLPLRVNKSLEFISLRGY